MSKSLQGRIESKKAKVGVVGLGYVGLPLAVEFAKAGFSVTGIDIADDRVDRISEGKNYISDVNDDELASLVAADELTATCDYSVVSDLDAISICVPTPLSKLKDPDVSFIQSALDEIVKHLHPNLLIVLESTTYPGTTRELVLPKLVESGLEIGKELFLCFSPERIDPGNEEYKIHNTPKVIGGVTETCGNLGTLLYEQIANEVVCVSSPEAAEMVKLLENTFRSINIGLANEVAIMCEKLGVDVWEVIDAAATKPFGFMKFTPGPGLGGHCIPVDPHYLAWKMKTLDYEAKFIELAGRINTAMPQHVVDLISGGLNEREKSVKGSRILLVGVSYKKDMDDVRESPSLDVLRLLEDQGATVDYYDPLVGKIDWNGENKSGLDFLESTILSGYDAVVILTNHSGIDYDSILLASDFVVDTRNVYANSHAVNAVRLGVGSAK
ncbi:MAG: nucleotide sugar dehydrogenase [Candidatus Marinimicrobia bacterium]|nr:nucleotide sugar dehydrogenase [Candidatus Neomarinimicrobiota bacterium]